MKQYVGFKNCTISLFNKKGDRFTQTIGDSGMVFRPPGYLDEISITIEQPTATGPSIFSHCKLRPAEEAKTSTKELVL